MQVVPNCNSRSGLGETADGSLYEIFRREFGAPGTPRFEAARQNFIASEAGCGFHYHCFAVKDDAQGFRDLRCYMAHFDCEVSEGKVCHECESKQESSVLPILWCTYI